MKNKPIRHKERNTFKFQPFSERIANVKVDVFHHVKHKYEEETEEATFFHQTLEKWNLLNCSESFVELKTDIGYNILILPQVLAQKDRLTDVLKKHLANKNPYNLQPLLELTVALAKDLRQEFYPYFQSIYDLLVALLHTKDADQLEWTFQCLAYLFKFLWRYLVNNISLIFETVLPLLGSTKPSYINNFAAQSFAFVARKLKDHNKLIKLILRSLKKYPQGLEGCGRLLFEIVRGVPGQFHSCAQETLKACFDSLEDPSLPYTPLCQLLTSTVSHCLSNIQVKHINLLWEIVKEKLTFFHNQLKNNEGDRHKENMKFMLTIVQQMIEFKGCIYVVEHEKLVNLLLKLLEPDNQIENEINVQISDSLINILLAPSLKLTQETGSKIVISAMDFLKEDEAILFLSKIFDYSGFQGLVLPRLIELSSAKDPFKMLPLLTKLILKKSKPARNVNDLLSWIPFTLDFTHVKKNDPAKYCDVFLKFLYSKAPIASIEELNLTISVLIILPHILPIQKNEIIATISNLVVSVCEKLNSDNRNNCSSNTTSLLTLLTFSLESLVKLKPDDCISKLCPPQAILDGLLPFVQNGNLLALRSLAFYISVDELNLIASFVPQIKASVVNNLLSPYHKIRELTTLIMYEIEKSVNESNILMVNLLEICWKAETIPATLTEYRDKVKELQKLSCTNESVSAGVQKNDLDYQVFLKFLIGNLYINFKLIWEPTSKIIASYATVLKPNQFWMVYGQELERIANVIRENKEESSIQLVFPGDDNLDEMFTWLNDLEEKPDHIHHRILLWHILEDCIPVCESKQRDVSTQFLLFMEQEYLKRNSEAAFSWDVRKKQDEENDVTVIETEMSVVENEEMDVDKSDYTIEEMEQSKDEENNFDEQNETNGDEVIKKELLEPVADSDQKFRWVTKSLLAHMAVLGKMRSPKNMYREPELAKIYYDFLSHKLPDVQKAALDCLMTYKHKFLLPYKENLYRLIDDKTFKSEITLFRIDTQSEIIKVEHRNDLIPIVLRIVYSKMYQSGVKGISKQAKKATVIRFLAGCSSEEIYSFFKMAFTLLKKDIETEEDVTTMVDRIIGNINLEQVVPPKRLQSAIYLVNTLLTHCGGLMAHDQLAYLLRILFALAANITGILKQRELVHPGHVRNLRNIRNVCFEGLNRFFTNFEAYPWTANEIDALFQVFIWPYLPSLPSDSVNSPTPMLRLFAVWSKNPRYFVLLGKTSEKGDLSPLSAIMQLFLSEKVHASVSSAIMELVESLLSFQDFDKNDARDGQMIQELQINGSAKLDTEKIDSLKISEKLNYGSKLLLSYTPTILARLDRKLQAKQPLLKKDMEVMSRITEMVTEPDSSDKLLTLLFPNLLKKSGAGEEVIIPLLTTVHNLIKNIHDPGKYVMKLAPLFGSVVGPVARKLLFNIVISLSKEKGSESGLESDLLEDLNAYDVKWVDQPDFTRRLAAFKQLEQMAGEQNISLNLGVIVIYTCFHFIRTEKDLALRDNALHCLETVAPALCYSVNENKIDSNLVINETILLQIRAGFSEKEADHVRDMSISFLGHMVRKCTDLHPVLKDLSVLTNDVDREVDFFDNIRHLQLHRRVRAMLKFTNIVQTLDKPMNPRTITQFILPIISHFLLSKKFSSKNTIVDSAVSALGTACNLLPWHQYQKVLLFYLGKLQEDIDFQKQLVKIIVEVLNAFHFDLSRADLNDANLLKTNEELHDESKSKSLNAEEEQSTNGTVSEQTSLVASEIKSCFEDELEDVETAEDKTEEQQPEQIVGKPKLLSKSEANKVIKAITVVILPQLHKILAQKNFSETFHKLSHKPGDANMDDDVILRIPLAVAIVKLLQKLQSKELLNRNLTGVLMKLCTFLKSRMESVRRVTRETLQTVMISLGPSYLRMLIKEMSAILIKGFHVHVLAFTIHSVLVSLKPNFQKGDLDGCIHSLLRVCKLDLFGGASEEKEVNQIAGKILEARSVKSYDIFQILATYTTENYLLDIILPLKEELSKTLSHKSVTKVEDCLQRIVLGLTENQFVDSVPLLQFAYGTSSESIPILTEGLKDKPVNPKQLEFESRRQPDVYLIPSEPKQKKALESKICIRTNAHLLVEFGLKLLFFLLKRSKVKGDEYKPHLDPFVELLMDCITSQHIKVSTLAIRCMTWCLRLELPSVEKNISQITEQLFQILHKFAASGLTKGENFDLVMATFKAVAVVVRDVKYHHLENDHKRALLLYCEQDLEDYNRQATAFSLLHAILLRKIQAAELNDIMKKVATLSITSNIDSVRHQARGVVLYYLKEYHTSIKAELVNFMAFYFSQLSFALESGRDSALEMLISFINTLPKDVVREHSSVMFINVATRLVNDISPACREKSAGVIELILKTIDNNSKEKLFDVTKLWFTDENLAHRRLAAQLVGIFVKCEKEDFHKRLDDFLPMVANQFIQGFQENKPGKFVLIKQEEEQSSLNSEERMRDHLLFQVLFMLAKICTSCSKFLKDNKYTGYLETIAEHTTDLLAYPHEWVRELAVHVLNLIIRTVPASELASIANDVNLEKEGFLLSNTKPKLKSLILDLIAQLVPDEKASDKFLLQCMKLLVYLAQVVKDIKDEEEDNKNERISLIWMVRRVRKSVNNEISQHPNSTIVRTMAFNWLAALSVKLSKEELNSIAAYILSPMLREMNLDDHLELKKVAKEAANCVKNKLGPEAYNSLVATLSTQLEVKRAEKKKIRTQMMVTDPERAAKRKINKQLKKKDAKKRKLVSLKTQKFKKKPKKEVDFED